MSNGSLSRREMVLQSAGGFGGLALAAMMSPNALALRSESQEAWNGGLHHRAKAKRVIQLFMNGGTSQVDTFDFKPQLEKRHDETVDFGIKATATGTPGPLMGSPFAWKRHGQCGRWVTDVFPHMAKHVDDLAFLMAMTSKTNVHGPASYLQTTGFLLPGFPSCGAWASYGLGHITDNLPSFVVLPDSRGLPYNGMGNFGAGFLPANHAGVVIHPSSSTPIPDLKPAANSKFVTDQSSRDGLRLLQELNNKHAHDRPGDNRLVARIESYELAAKMQLAAPEAFELNDESMETHTAYGTERSGHDGSFSKNCLTARRLIERGVRFVQVWSGPGGPTNNWDNHGNIPKELPPIARQVDQPIAALLTDLKMRGLMSDTIVIWTTEFGRMPFTQNGLGRDHNGGTFVTWLAGAGIRPGVSHGSSDEFSYRAVENVTYGYDLHATLFHLLGIDHERLTMRHNGIDRRLTDVHGQVIQEILA
ncbi:MAG: DUF1501 domain-containing protein [Pirellula sp.]